MLQNEPAEVYRNGVLPLKPSISDLGTSHHSLSFESLTRGTAKIFLERP
jgi:hypothetical protein